MGIDDDVRSVLAAGFTFKEVHLFVLDNIRVDNMVSIFISVKSNILAVVVDQRIRGELTAQIVDEEHVRLPFDFLKIIIDEFKLFYGRFGCL